MMTSLLNCTEHDVVITFGRKQFTIKPCGVCPRVESRTSIEGMVGAIPIMSVDLYGISDLPDKQEGTLLIVSRMVADAGQGLGRDDLVYPVNLIRDDKGRVVGAEGLGYTKRKESDGQ